MLILPTKKVVKFLALFCSSGILLLMLFPLITTAAFTKQINYQGKLTNASGAAVADGSKTMIFRLYNVPTGGTALWTETDTVTTAGGLFSLMLGSTTDLSSVDFNQPLYLSLEVNGDGEMSPRKTLGAVASSFNTLSFDGLATSSFLRSDISNATGTITNLNSEYLSVTGNMTAGSITLNGVTRTSWPGGGSGTDVNWSYNPLTDMLTPATSTSGIIVNGTSTLATTTMAFGSSFGLPGGSNITASDYMLNDLGNAPLLSFNAPGMIIPALQKLGGVSEGLGLFEGDANPVLYFVDKTLDLAQLMANDAHLAAITYGTTSRKLLFSSALGGYDFDQSINLAAGKCLSLDGTCTGATSWADNGSTLYVADSSKNLLFGNSNSFGSTTQGLFIIGGSYNFASSTNGGGGIIGGSRNHLEDGGLIITTGFDNYSNNGGIIIGAGNSTSTAGSIFGGNGNQTFDNFNAAIVGGAGNIASSTNGGVFAGEGNLASGWRSVIVGGSDNITWGLASGIYNGSGNTVSGVASSILGGDDNYVGTTSWGSTILGGKESEVHGYYSSILAGNNNLIVGDNSVALDGSYNTITGNYSDIIGGARNWISGHGSYAFGYNMSVNANSSFGFGLRVTDGNSTTSNYLITQENVMAIMGGNVGIGTTSPAEVLDVQGNIQISKGNYLKYNGANLAFASTTLENYFFGGSGNLIMTGTQNLGLGRLSLSSNTTGSANVASGYTALQNNTTGSDNVANGFGALYSNTSGSNNVANGYSALRLNTIGAENVANGFNALYNNNGTGNVANGSNALYSNTSGYYNTGNGIFSLYKNTTGFHNVANGSQALYSNVTGNSNVAEGSWSLYSASTTVGLTALGYYSGVGPDLNSDYNSWNDTYSTFIGYQASRDNNIASTSAITNATAIGYNARVGGSNMLVLGGTGSYAVKVGIGTSTPGAALDIVGNYTGYTSASYGQRSLYNFNPANTTVYPQYGSYLEANASSSAGTNITGGVTGSAVYANHYGGGLATTMYGLVTGINNYGSGAITNTYGLYLASTTGNISGTNYGIYQLGASTTNYFAGNINIGSSSFYKYNGVNLAFASTTLDNYFLGNSGNIGTVGSRNIALGSGALSGNVDGSLNSGGSNIALGYNALHGNTIGEFNVAIGTNALSFSNGGDHNIAIGNATLFSNSTGGYNIAMGDGVLTLNNSGGNNIALGENTLGQNIAGSSNIAFGFRTLFNNKESNNIAIGEGALEYASGTVGMVALGHKAGGLSGDNYGSLIDTYSTFLGYQSSRDNNIASTSAITNATAIGYNARVGGSNMLVLGGVGAGAVSVGIGTSTPNAFLNIYGSSSASNLLRIATSTNQNILLVNNNGGVTIGSLSSNGAVCSSGGLLTNTCPSSLEYKDNIIDASLNIEGLLGLQVKTFNWKNNGQADFGLIAEDIKNALPELYLDDGVTKGYRMDHLPFYLLQIAQRQEANIKALQEALGANGLSVGADGVLVVKSIKADNVISENGVTVRDRTTGGYSCVYVDNGAIKTSAGECSAQGSGPSVIGGSGYGEGGPALPEAPVASTSPEIIAPSATGTETGYGAL